MYRMSGCGRVVGELVRGGFKLELFFYVGRGFFSVFLGCGYCLRVFLSLEFCVGGRWVGDF